MIARIWHGVTAESNADSYLDYLNQTGLPDYRQTTGNLGAFVLRQVENGKAHFLTLSFWDSLDAIRHFAGKNYDRAKYYPEDKNYLLDLEPTVEHYELFGETSMADHVLNFGRSRQLQRLW